MGDDPARRGGAGSARVAVAVAVARGISAGIATEALVKRHEA